MSFPVGETSGKPLGRTATYTPGTAGLSEQASGGTSAIAQARDKALERGEKLGYLEDASARMREEAEVYGRGASQLANKYKNKKWWNPF